jgi:hypothetical protein
MWKPFGKQKQEQAEVPNPPPESVGGDFDAAAARVTSVSGTPEDAGGSEPEQQEEAEHFTIKEEWAEGAIKAVYWPLAEYHHPAWAITEEEARTGGPKLLPLVQAIADRYAPAFLGRLTTRHPELFDALGFFAVLTFVKFKQVARAMAQEAEAQAAKAREPQSAPSPGEDADEHTCELCKEVFASRAKFAAHLPCKRAN